MPFLDSRSIRFASIHLAVSVLIACVSAYLVFEIFYPKPYWEMQAIYKIFWIVVAVDLILGPLFTLILARSKKSIREVSVDLTLIAVVQFLALSYGIFVLWQARPVVLAFEEDRIVLVSAAEIDNSSLSEAPVGLRVLPFAGVLRVATRKPKNNKEFFEGIDLSLSGSSPAMRPGWWESMDLHKDEMKSRVKPLSGLLLTRPSDKLEIESLAKRVGRSIGELSFLPLTSNKTKDWIVVFDGSLMVVGYLPIDGF